MVHLTVCYYHVTYEFQSESTLYNLPECQGTPWSKQPWYWSLSDNNVIRTHNHLVRKGTLNHLAKGIQAEACNFIKKEALAQVFSCEFCEFLRTPFLTEHLRWLLLKYATSLCVYKNSRITKWFFVWIGLSHVNIWFKRADYLKQLHNPFKRRPMRFDFLADFLKYWKK